MASTEQCEADSGVVSVAGEITKVPLDKEVGEIVVVDTDLSLLYA